MKFIRRYECPELDNKYYIPVSQGGWNPGIPKKQGSNLFFANCVFYAIGRFNEIGGTKDCRYLKPTNAENFVNAAKAAGLTVSQVPTLGGCMVWACGEIGNGNDGAGHVAIVEAINENGIITSESGWNAAKCWWTSTRSGSNWGQNGSYRYLGCIQNPAHPFDAEPKAIYRVQVGAFISYDNAAAYAKQLQQHGIQCFIVKE